MMIALLILNVTLYIALKRFLKYIEPVNLILCSLNVAISQNVVEPQITTVPSQQWANDI